jgi:hypothetical protein
MVSVTGKKCEDCKWCGRRSSGDRFCIHPFMKQRNHRMNEIFLLSAKEVLEETRCTMFEEKGK